MKNVLFFIVILAGQAFFSLTYASPAQVVIIRHGEKPAVGNELSPLGWQRANLLPQFFENNKIVNQFGKPIALYAGSPSKPGGSVRSIQTITPFANQLGMKIHTEITRDDISTLVSEVMNKQEYDGHTVIICWEHNMIPQMANLFGAANTPSSWDGNVFDRAWILKFNNNQVSDFLNLPQHLLATDSEE